jgi:hypothetical protein
MFVNDNNVAARQRFLSTRSGLLCSPELALEDRRRELNRLEAAITRRTMGERAMSRIRSWRLNAIW